MSVCPCHAGRVCVGQVPVHQHPTSRQRLGGTVRTTAEGVEERLKDAGMCFPSCQSVPGKGSAIFFVFSTLCLKPVQSLAELVDFLLVQVPPQDGPPSYLQLLVLPGWLWGAAVPFQWPGAQSPATHRHVVSAASPERFPCLGRRSASGTRIQHSDHVKSGKKKPPAPSSPFGSWDKRGCFAAEKTEQPFMSVMKNKSRGNRNNKNQSPATRNNH